MYIAKTLVIKTVENEKLIKVAPNKSQRLEKYSEIIIFMPNVLVPGAKLPDMKMACSCYIYVTHYISNTVSQLLVFIASVKNLPLTVYG